MAPRQPARRSVPTGGAPVAGRYVNDRVVRNHQKITPTQRTVEATARVTTARDRRLSDLAAQLRAESEAAAARRANTRVNFANARLYDTHDNTRYYNSAVRTGDGQIGSIRGVGTTATRRYRAFTDDQMNEQPTDSGNGNSPPTRVGGNRRFRMNGNASRTVGLTSRGRQYANRGR